MRRVDPITLLTILLAAALRAPLLASWRFHPDEALFAALARRIAQGIDPLLTGTPLLVDKPPLFYYFLSAGVSIGWGEELAARLPGYFAGLISVALVAALARAIWADRRITAAAALLLALNPFHILLSATALADPQLIAWWLAAWLFALKRQPLLLGLALGCALATKQTALFLIPLPLWCWLADRLAEPASHAVLRRDLALLFLGSLPSLGFVLGWELARGPAPGFWGQGLEANNPGRLARLDELLPRLQGWLTWLTIPSGGPWTLIPGLLLGTLGTLYGLRRHPRPWLIGGLAGFLIAYAGLIWLLPFPLYDRYLLPLIIASILLIAAGAGHLPDLICHPAGHFCRRGAGFPLLCSGVTGGTALLLLIPLVFFALRAARGDFPIGADRGAYDGIDLAGEWFDSVEAGSVVYTDSLGWPLAFYAFDAPIWLATFPTPGWITLDLGANGMNGSARYLLVPAWQENRLLLESVGRAGWRAVLIRRFPDRAGQPNLDLFRLEPPDD